MRISVLPLAALLGFVALPACAQTPATPPAQAAPRGRPEDTELYTPVPPVVTPAPNAGITAGAPSDAIVLFDGHDLSQWTSVNDSGPARWTVADGILTVLKPSGNIQTRRRFTNYQLHIEWRVPPNVTGTGQLRGNSGIFLASTGAGDAGYELQILDSYKNSTYVNGQAASIYKQFPPLANASRPTGEWQAYDVIWTAPVFGANGTLTSPAYVTVFHNGVLVQDHTLLRGQTLYIGKPSYTAHGPSPIKLQAHGDPSPPLSFRNIWVRELPPEPRESVPPVPVPTTTGGR